MLADQAMPGQPSQNNKDLDQCQKIERVLGCLESLSEIDERSDAELKKRRRNGPHDYDCINYDRLSVSRYLRQWGRGEECDSPDHFETRLSSWSMAAVKLLKQGFR